MKFTQSERLQHQTAKVKIEERCVSPAAGSRGVCSCVSGVERPSPSSFPAATGDSKGGD